MKLYMHTAACSLSPHIVCRELGLDVELVAVDRATHRTTDGGDYLALNGNGYVPLLELEDGTQLRGIVETQPGVQAFFDPDGREGMNALLRLDASAEAGAADRDGIHDIWLDTIRAVTRLPNPSPPQPSTRHHPPDPNAGIG